MKQPVVYVVLDTKAFVCLKYFDILTRGASPRLDMVLPECLSGLRWRLRSSKYRESLDRAAASGSTSPSK